MLSQDIPLRSAPLAMAAVALLASAAMAVEPGAAGVEFFETRIRPVLVEHCYACHNSSETAEAGLVLDHRDGLRKGGDSGAVVTPGKPEESRLLQVVRHQIDGLKMPEDGPKLDEKTIADLEQWIAMGAPDPRDKPPSADELAKATSWEATRERRRQWWSFQPIRKPKTPDVGRDGWSDHPVDRFILARLEASRLEPAGQANRRTLIRRLCFALTGLPPTPEEIESFLADDRSDAYERLIDRLLASEHFGERWARHWMDWFRYADTHGGEDDHGIPHAYRYRDYLIRALNRDVPYDQLVREHIAGDLLANPRTNEELGINESAIGTAQWRMVAHGHSPTDALDEKVRFTDDQINVVSKTFLALTVSCARCHDHKFDPISQNDYYALFGIFGSCRPALIDVNTPERKQLHRDRLTELKREIRRVVADAWLESASSFPDRLSRAIDALIVAKKNEEKKAEVNEGKDKKKKEKKKKNVEDKGQDGILQIWLAIEEEVKQAGTFTKVWQERLAAWNRERADIQEHRQRDYIQQWDLASAEDFGDWFAEGNGLDAGTSQAGEFAVAIEGDRILTGIYPAGTYSHRLSTKHRGVLASPRWKLDGEYDVWLRAAGDHRAMVRYVIQNYPLFGETYPKVTLQKGTWRWLKFDAAYWDGDHIHLELATAADPPAMGKRNDRSWFGVREAVVTPSGGPAPPADDHEFFEPLFAAAGDAPPESMDDLAGCFERALITSIRAWRDGKITDAQALFLDASLQGELLPNRLDQMQPVKRLIEEYRRLEEQIPLPTRVPGIVEADAFDQPLFVRGDHKKPTDPVPRRFLEAIDATPYQTRQSGRLEFAGDLVRSDNPLTTRVVVNRIWHYLFGHGIVRTPDNFGHVGDKPTHPELLDFLAARFVENGWSIKDTIRFILTSKTWQLDSRSSAEAQQIDPANLLLSHANVRRLDAEAIRDSMLAISGQLDSSMFGPSSKANSDTGRRSVYVATRRLSLDKFLQVFDAPVPFATTGRRDTTNVPAQSLTLLNDPQVIRMSRQWATQVINDPTGSAEGRIRRMFVQALGREPSASELAALERFATSLLEEYPLRAGESSDEPPGEHQVWADLAHAIFNLKEFIYVK